MNLGGHIFCVKFLGLSANGHSLSKEKAILKETL